MDKQIQFSINRNMLILVSVIIILLIIALCARDGRRGYNMKMMREGNMMMQKKMQAGYPVEQGRWVQPPTEEQLASTSIELQ